MSEEHELLKRMDGKMDKVCRALYGEPDNKVPGLLDMKRDFYGNGKMGDHQRLRWIWKGGGLVLLIAGYGLRSLVGLVFELVMKR